MPTSRADFVDFSQVKKSVSILQILERYQLTEKLRRSGDSLSGSCPLHNGDNPTQFRVSASKNCWNCFGKCKRGGNILDFVSLKEGVSIRQAALLIQEWFGVQTSKAQKQNGNGKSSTEPVAKPPVEAPPEATEDETTENKPLGFILQHLDPAHPYLSGRGLTAETIAEFGLGYCAKGILANRIAIPIRNAEGLVVGYVGRWPGDPPEGKPKYQLPKGFKKSLEVFNLDRAAKEDKDKPLIVVEGFFDCIKVWQAGFHRVVAIMGSSLSEAQEALIVAEAGKIILMLDADDAGNVGANQAAIRLARHAFVRIVSIPSPATQPDELDEDELRNILTEVV